jgi:hypothetical protein
MWWNVVCRTAKVMAMITSELERAMALWTSCSMFYCLNLLNSVAVIRVLVDGTHYNIANHENAYKKNKEKKMSCD